MIHPYPSVYVRAVLLLGLVGLLSCNSSGDGESVLGDPSLSSLALSVGTLVPDFDPATTSYGVSVGFLATQTGVSATPTEADAEVTANSQALSTAVRLAEGSTTVTVRVRTAGGATTTYVITVTRATAATFAQQVYLKASNTNANDEFGGSVALAGDTLAVGAPFEASAATGTNGDQTDNSTLNSGSVYVFTRTGTTWSQQAYLKASNTGVGDQFGTRVALAGDTLTVAAPFEASAATGINGDQTDNSAFRAGAVYVFTRAGTTWSQQAYLKASNTGANDRFGFSIALTGDTLAVGAAAESSAASGINGDQTDNSASAAGAVYVFTRAGTTWSQQAYLKASNTAAGDAFGVSVSLGGDTLAVGAAGESSAATGVNGDQTDNSAGFAGAVYVFTRTGTTWSQQAYLKASNTDAGDAFGNSVALDGDTLAVGAAGESSAAAGIDGDQTDNSAGFAGAVYVFTRTGTTWSQQAYLKASNTGASDEFGFSMALTGDTLAVGAPLERSAATGINGDQADDSAANAGAIYVFTRTGTTWSQQAYLKASNTGASDEFGFSMALAGNTLAVGAFGEDSAATGINGDQTDNSLSAAGAVYVSL